MARRPQPQITFSNLKHFAAAAVGLTLCIALIAGDNVAEVEDGQIAVKQASHKAAKLASAGNKSVAQTGGGVIIGMTTRNMPRKEGGWGGGAGSGGGGAAAAPAPGPVMSGLDGQQLADASMPPDHPILMSEDLRKPRPAGGPRGRKRSADAPTPQQLNDILAASRRRAMGGV